MLFVRDVLKPNVLMYKEQGSGSNYHKLKDKLDNISEDQDVVLDFSLCEFVDNTVIYNLNVYRELGAINE